MRWFIIQLFSFTQLPMVVYSLIFFTFDFKINLEEHKRKYVEISSTSNSPRMKIFPKTVKYSCNNKCF